MANQNNIWCFWIIWSAIYIFVKCPNRTLSCIPEIFEKLIFFRNIDNLHYCRFSILPSYTWYFDIIIWQYNKAKCVCQSAVIDMLTLYFFFKFMNKKWGALTQKVQWRNQKTSIYQPLLKIGKLIRSNVGLFIANSTHLPELNIKSK